MRTAGIILPIFSLPGSVGIGSIGRPAHQFLDFLEQAGQHQWLMLPIGPTSYKDSPYQSFSAFAGNPYLIDLDQLQSSEEDKIDYEWLFRVRMDQLKQIYKSFVPDIDFFSFQEKNKYWLKDYALFMALKEIFNYQPWIKWPKEYRYRNQASLDAFQQQNQFNILFFEFVQFLFFNQWQQFKQKAKQKAIELIGDVPIYVAYDSADVWSHPNLFLLNEKYKPTKVAGVPPDYFSKTGQLWGNPLYNWQQLEKEDYSWWIKRINHQMNYFDRIRIDHFRGFAAFYAIDASYKTARKGEWITGPGISFFNKLQEKLGKVNIIAEDLGLITPDVQLLLKQSGFPGMRVLQFGYDEEDSIHLPIHYPTNCVAFTGTHDNLPLQAWLENLPQSMRKKIGKDVYALIEDCMQSQANLVLIPIQDYLQLKASSRINAPGTDNNNWTWRIKSSELSVELAQKIKIVTKKANR